MATHLEKALCADIVAHLNHLHKIDPTFLQKLYDVKLTAKEEMDVVVGDDMDCTFIGVLNGLFINTNVRICVHDEKGTICGFEVLELDEDAEER